jgi:hypothetical protein
MEQTEIDCEEFLLFWNVITDLAHSADIQFSGNKDSRSLNEIYDKLYIGSQLPTKDEGNSLNQPVWSSEERMELIKVIEDGLRVIDVCLVKKEN